MRTTSSPTPSAGRNTTPCSGQKDSAPRASHPPPTLLALVLVLHSARPILPLALPSSNNSDNTSLAGALPRRRRTPLRLPRRNPKNSNSTKKSPQAPGTRAPDPTQKASSATSSKNSCAPKSRAPFPGGRTSVPRRALGSGSSLLMSRGHLRGGWRGIDLGRLGMRRGSRLCRCLLRWVGRRRRRYGQNIFVSRSQCPQC